MEKAPRKSPKVRTLGVAALFVSLCSANLYATRWRTPDGKSASDVAAGDLARDDGERVDALAAVASYTFAALSRPKGPSC